MKERGFTLIELLITLLVLTAVLLPMSSMIYSVMRATNQTKGSAAAATLVQDKLENLKHAAFNSLSSGSDSATLAGINYNRQWSVTASSNVKTIIVTVTWNDPIAHQVSLTTVRGA